MIVCGIATLKEREQSFRAVLDAICSQVDEVFATLNNYPDIPSWVMEYGNLDVIPSDNSWGDIGKVRAAEFVNGYYLSLDDDLVPPPGYVRRMIAAVDKYKCIVTMHGKRYVYPVKSYRKNIAINVRCTKHSPSDIRVHVGGTGCMAWHTDDFKVRMDMFEKANMLDVLLSREAKKQGVKIMALAHPEGYFRYIKPEATIWEQNIDESYQTAVINEMLKR